MRKLALDDEILLSIEKPARYIGNGKNSIMKKKMRWISVSPCVFRMFARSACRISAFRFCMICLTEETMFGVNASILRGQILIQLCVKRNSAFCIRVT